MSGARTTLDTDAPRHVRTHAAMLAAVHRLRQARKDADPSAEAATLSDIVALSREHGDAVVHYLRTGDQLDSGLFRLGADRVRSEYRSDHCVVLSLHPVAQGFRVSASLCRDVDLPLVTGTGNTPDDAVSSLLVRMKSYPEFSMLPVW